MYCADNSGFRLAYYYGGVTTGITAPTSKGFLSGLSAAFGTGQLHRLAKGAIVQDIAALHVSIDSSTPSVSTQIFVLRNLLLGGGQGELAARFKDVVQVSKKSNSFSKVVLLNRPWTGEIAISYRSTQRRYHGFVDSSQERNRDKI